MCMHDLYTGVALEARIKHRKCHFNDFAITSLCMQVKKLNAEIENFRYNVALHMQLLAEHRKPKE